MFVSEAFVLYPKSLTEWRTLQVITFRVGTNLTHTNIAGLHGIKHSSLFYLGGKKFYNTDSR